jgi:hypothetical protein
MTAAPTRIVNGSRCVLRVDGSIEQLEGKVTMAIVDRLIEPPQGTDCVWLKHLGWPRMVMIVDDTGMIDARPVNPEATRLYLANCRDGSPYAIHGDVVVCPDEDFAP